MAIRSIPATRFAILIDGTAVGFVKSVSGGNIKGVVATHDMGPDNVVKKHLAAITLEPITVECGMSMGKELYDWIRSSFDKPHISRSGEVVSADFDFRAKRAIVFDDALITECNFPALDASSKEPAYITIKFSPERLRHEKRNGERVSAKVAAKTKKWLRSGFKFELGDLPCARVSKIDSFTLKQTVVRDRADAGPDLTKPATKIEVPNLKVTFSDADADPWEDWFRGFVIDGKCSDSDELDGQILFLGPDAKEELGRIELSHVGIISLRPAQREANGEEVARMEAELYVEEMKLHFNAVDA